MASLKHLNLALRALMELGLVLGFGYWGYTVGDNTAFKMLLAVGAPLVAFGFWGLVDFRQAGRLAEPLRLIQELVLCALAAVAWGMAGAPALGWAMGIVALVHHTLVYALGERLLKQKAA